MQRPARPGRVLLLVGLLAGWATPGAAATGTRDIPELVGEPMEACTIHSDVPVSADLAGYCGTLRVPEDRANPAGRSLGLRVVVVPAASEPRSDPLFAVAGGPSDAATTFFAWLPDLYADVHAVRDIVLVDQRGTGASNPLVLPEMPDTSSLPASEADTRLRGWMRDSLAGIDADPRFYTTTVAADDLDDVRAALGYDRIDLYGTSYGGTLVQYYIRQHPDHVRVAVLDGATPLDVPVLERIAVNSQHALDLLLQRCEQDASCHAAFPDIVEEWSTLEAGLAKGITTDVVDPETGAHAVTDLGQVGPSIHAALLTESTAAALPLAFHLAHEGRWGQAAELIPSVAPRDAGPTVLMADEVLCSEAWARFDPAEVAAVGGASYATPAQLADAGSLATRCRYLSSGVVPANDGAPVVTAIPMLWLTADGDPQDPPANLASIGTQQPNSLVVVMPAQEHVVGHLGCGPTVIAAFLERGSVDGLDTACITGDGRPGLAFRVP